MSQNLTNLIADIGNTRSKLALFENDKLIKKEAFPTLEILNLIEFTTNHSIEKSIFSMSGELPDEIRKFVSDTFDPIWLSHTTPLPITIEYDTPQTLGRDRIAAVIGANEKFPENDCLVIDAGTCITYDWITKDGRYKGGNIAPGLKMKLKAMHQFTANLPEAPMHPIRHPIGKSTLEALTNGAVWGTFNEIEGYIDWGNAQFEDLLVVFTGGDSNFFVNNIKREIFADPDLVLVGLNKILNFND
ncbi:MAG: type III pantothenate kinase [Saprospiraceae bacterium]|nr:type III pantothenate kinase [Saprospiraceae bacterium]